MSSAESVCRFCGKQIRWVTTKNGLPMPVNSEPMTVCILNQPADGWRLNRRPWARTVKAWVPHFGSCPTYPSRRGSEKREADFHEAVDQQALDLADEKERYP